MNLSVKIKDLVLIMLMIFGLQSCSTQKNNANPTPEPVKTVEIALEKPKNKEENCFKNAADRPELYLPLLKNKTVAIVANQTSLLADKTHLVDFLVQNNIKRLLAYSSIANMGYAMLGLLSGTADGVAAVIIYLTIYMVMVAGVFAVLMSVRRSGEALEHIPDFAGLSKTSPFMAYALTAFLFSMSGIPPLAGFFGKLFVFQAAVNGGFMVVAVIGVLTSVVAAYYYLRVIKVMFFDESAGEVEVNASLSRHFVAVGALTFVIVFTFLPNQLLHRAIEAASSLFS